VMSAPKFGVDDSSVGVLIERANELSNLRLSGRFGELSGKLESDLVRYRSNVFAQSRILNELADLHTYQLLDLEKAIDFDARLGKVQLIDADIEGNFVPKYMVASQKIIADQNYLKEYLSATTALIGEASARRTDTNRQLLLGTNALQASRFEMVYLQRHLNEVKQDIGSTVPKSTARYQILSRLIRADYEMSTKRADGKVGEYQIFLNHEISPAKVELAEINFLQLSDYFVKAFRTSGDIRFAEYALDTVYLPYINLRDAAARWRYNKLINEYISLLIDANYKSKQFEEMLYYVNLNKSRMLLEERLSFGSGDNTLRKAADLTAADGIPRTSAGLPTKDWYKQRLAKTDAYLDFYAGGKYVAVSTGQPTKEVVRQRAYMPLNSRQSSADEGGEGTPVDAFADDELFVSFVKSGKVQYVKKVTGSALAQLKQELNASYGKVSDYRLVASNTPSFFKTLEKDGAFQKTLVISPDKWIAQHPLDLYMNAQVVRTVNFFTANDSNQIANLNALGFMNPTLDLKGADAEADVLKAIVPGAQIFRREHAKLSSLKGDSKASIVHLSMHGMFDSNDPKNSKLFFAGSQHRTPIANDVNALYARDMGRYSVLRERDLIFAAACQTGLSAADRVNENELMGILRPLTAARNRNIILSLWNVDDEATKEFVSAFYQNLSLTKHVADSFHFAQAAVKAKYPQPYFWAAFYLSQSN
jgi:CHAT domain